MNWITRERPKIDRIACPWLIRRFIDPEATFFFVPADDVLTHAEALHATPFDVTGAEFTHYEDRCTFDYFLEKYQLTDPALRDMAPIIRGADTDNHALAAQAAGLWAISAGLAFNTPDDQELIEKGFMLYDSLYTWAKYLQKQPHTAQTEEKRLLDVFHSYLERKKQEKQPDWVPQLKGLIQDQIDTQFSLRELAEGLRMHPSYVSREFSRYFDDLSFGEYIRKLRIEKALDLLEHSAHSLAEIAYLTGFSDQSHFSRVFKAHTGKSPSDFRKNLSPK